MQAGASCSREHQLVFCGLEVLRLMGEGCSNAEIASRLFTSPRTIDHHVSAILTKLGVHSRAQAIHAAFHQELLPNSS